MPFTHLHCHSYFSLLDGAAPPKELCQRAGELGMNAMAVTDHNTLAGAVRFFQAAKAAGIKPIIGVEFTVELVDRVSSRQSRQSQRQTARKLPPLCPPGHIGADRIHSPRTDTTTDYTRYAHLVLLAEDNEGYSNLCRLVTCARLGKAQHSGPFSDEFSQIDRKKPVLSQEHLRQHASHLICLSGCEKGEIPRLVAAGRWREAMSVAEYYREVFGEGNFYIEVQNNLLPQPERGLRYKLQNLADRLGVPLVATNNVHYVEREYARAQDILVCMRALQTVNEYHPDRKTNAEYSLKPAHEMTALFPDQPEAIRNTLEIAERCNWELDLETFHFPRFDLGTVGGADEARRPDTSVGPEAVTCRSGLQTATSNDGRALESAPTRDALIKGGYHGKRHRARAVAIAPLARRRLESAPTKGAPTKDALTVLRHLCYTRARDLYPEITDEVRGRIEHELKIISDQRLCDYFLIVWDICRFARSHRIMTTGRGSAGDSIISYLLDITSVDPLAHDLLFERFLNPKRRQMPDIDVDFDSRRRDEVTAYIYRRYGAERVAAVCTVNTFRARSAVREVGKALGMDEKELGALAEILPHVRASEIAEAAERFPEVRDSSIDLSDKTLLLELCEQISGFPRHLSVHVGGLVIGAERLTNMVPLALANKGIVICEFDKDDVEALGLVKMDILGLRTHTAISACLDLIKERTGERIDLGRIPLDDEKTFELLRSTHTIGLFQLESPGQRNLLGRAQPREFEEVIANISLFRPGPVQSDMIKPYIRRKHGIEPVTYLHPALEPIMRRTFGVLIYQEQVLEIASAIAGFSLGEADQLRRLMTSDRSKDDMMKLGETFIEKATQRGVEREVAEEVFRMVSGFAAYGFCKAHAACFGKISYQTAWLKAHYPAEFMAGILSAQPMGFYPPRTVAEEAKRLGCKVLPPCVNRSEDRFTVEGPNTSLLSFAVEGPNTSLLSFAGEVSGPSAAPGIRVGLRLLRGMSEAAMRSILEAREHGGPFQSLRDFCERTRVPRPVVENLILVRAFEFTGHSEQELLWLPRRPDTLACPEQGRRVGPNPGRSGLQTATSAEVRTINDNRALESAPTVPPLSYQALCDDFPEAILGSLPEFTPTAPAGRVALDLNICHVSTTVNPFSFWRERMEAMGVTPSTELYQRKDGDRVRVAGIVIARARPPTRSGKTAIFISLEDEFGVADVAVFEDCYQRCGQALYTSPVLCVEGKLTRQGALDLSVTAENVIGMGSWRDFQVKSTKSTAVPSQTAVNGSRNIVPSPESTARMHGPHGGHAWGVDNKLMDRWEPRVNAKVGERRG